MAELAINKVKISKLKAATYNPRKWSESATKQLTESITRFGLVDPILVNSAKGRENIVIGGHFRLKVAKDLGLKEVPVCYIDIPEVEKEKELNIRLNKNLGDWDYDLLKDFDSSLLDTVGFSSEELDDIFDIDVDNPEVFDIDKELAKLDIDEVTVKKGDIWQLGEHRLVCGDSTDPEVYDKLMSGAKANMCLTDPPYRLKRYSIGRRDGCFKISAYPASSILKALLQWGHIISFIFVHPHLRPAAIFVQNWFVIAQFPSPNK